MRQAGPHDGAQSLASSRLTWPGASRSLPGNEPPQPPSMLLRRLRARPSRYGPRLANLSHPLTRPPPRFPGPLHVGQVSSVVLPAARSRVAGRIDGLGRLGVNRQNGSQAATLPSLSTRVVLAPLNARNAYC